MRGYLEHEHVHVGVRPTAGVRAGTCSRHGAVAEGRKQHQGARRAATSRASQWPTCECRFRADTGQAVSPVGPGRSPAPAAERVSRALRIRGRVPGLAVAGLARTARPFATAVSADARTRNTVTSPAGLAAKSAATCERVRAPSLRPAAVRILSARDRGHLRTRCAAALRGTATPASASPALSPPALAHGPNSMLPPQATLISLRVIGTLHGSHPSHPNTSCRRAAASPPSPARTSPPHPPSQHTNRVPRHIPRTSLRPSHAQLTFVHYSPEDARRNKAHSPRHHRGFLRPAYKPAHGVNSSLTSHPHSRSPAHTHTPPRTSALTTSTAVALLHTPATTSQYVQLPHPAHTAGRVPAAQTDYTASR